MKASSPPLGVASARHGVHQLLTGKGDSFHRALLEDELLVRRLPVGPQKLCVPVGYALVGVPLPPVVAPEILQPLFVTHGLVLGVRRTSGVGVKGIQ